MKILERVFQVTVFVVAAFMIWGGGFFWRQAAGRQFHPDPDLHAIQALARAAAGAALLPGGGYRHLWAGAAVRFQAALCLVAATP